MEATLLHGGEPDTFLEARLPFRFKAPKRLRRSPVRWYRGNHDALAPDVRL